MSVENIKVMMLLQQSAVAVPWIRQSVDADVSNKGRMQQQQKQAGNSLSRCNYQLSVLEDHAPPELHCCPQYTLRLESYIH
jgi:hypothetical protein